MFYVLTVMKVVLSVTRSKNWNVHKYFVGYFRKCVDVKILDSIFDIYELICTLSQMGIR